MARILATTLLACAISGHAQQYDLVLRNGQVLDPKNNVDAKRDVAIRDGKIAAIEPAIPADATLFPSRGPSRQAIATICPSWLILVGSATNPTSR
jgi:hypothetical protein